MEILQHFVEKEKFAFNSGEQKKSIRRIFTNHPAKTIEVTHATINKKVMKLAIIMNSAEQRTFSLLLKAKK
jgi:hypothetical protein